MPGPRPEDQYNPVQTIAPTTGAPNDYLTVRSNPNQFGGQVGQAVQKLGATGEQVGNQTIETATQYQGMLNESAATDLNTQAIIQRGEILNKYKTMEGFDAVNARENTIAALAAVRQNLLSKVSNPAVARAFNMLDSRQEGYSINDANGWGAVQAKTAAAKSATSSVQLSVDAASNPDVAQSDSRVADNIANIKFNVSRMMQLQGYGNYMSQDPKTGEVQFDDSTEGQQASAVYKQTLNASIGKAYENIYDVKAFDPTTGNVQKAVQWLNNNKSKMPAETYAKLIAKSAAPLRNAQARNESDNVFSQWEGKRVQEVDTQLTGKFTPDQLADKFITQESTNGLTSKNLGQIQPATWEAYTSGKLDGVPHPGVDIDNAKDNRAATTAYLGYLSKKFNNDPARIAVAYFSGEKNVAPTGSATPWVNDTQDHNGKTVSSYVGDIERRLSPTGFQSQADFYSTHYDQISDQIRDSATITHPDDPAYVDSAVAHGQQKMNEMIQQQRIMDHADVNSILKYVTDPQNPVTNIQSLNGPNTPQDVREAYQRQLVYNPLGMQSLEKNLITANSKGAAIGYGTDFWNQYSKVMSGQVHNINDLTSLVGEEGKNAPLTNTGYKLLNDALNKRNTPQGAALATAELNFFKGMHQEYTASAIAPSFHYAAGEAQFQKFMAEALPKIQAGLAQGKTTGEMFDPKSKDYVGHSVYVQPPKQADIMKAYKDQAMKDAINASQLPVKLADYKTLNDLVGAVKSGKVDRKSAEQFALSQHWIAPNPPPVPLPAP